MHHLCAYFESIDNTANTEVNALQEAVLQRRNNRFYTTYELQVLAAFAASATLNRCRLVTPTNRQVTLPMLHPINVATLPASDPNVADIRKSPFNLRAHEDFSLEATSDVAMGNENFHGLLVLAERLVPAPRGDIYVLRGTSTDTATANAWTTLSTVTYDDTLPPGTYALVGLVVQSTNAIAARVIFEGGWWRPGSVSITALGNRTHDMFYKGGLGDWGHFTHVTIPQIEVLCDMADASHVVYLELIRLSGPAIR